MVSVLINKDDRECILSVIFRFVIANLHLVHTRLLHEVSLFRAGGDIIHDVILCALIIGEITQ
jgi:hypothetical protein